MDMFEKATRLKLRFPTSRGPILAEDLWDLPLTSETGKPNLDDVARTFHRHLKATGDDVLSFVEPEKKSDDGTIQLAFDIVKHIIAVRVAERNARKTERERAEKKQQLLALIADKQADELKGKSVDELIAMVNAL